MTSNQQLIDELQDLDNDKYVSATEIEAKKD